MRRLIFFAIAISVIIGVVILVDFSTFVSAVAGLPRETVLILIVLLTISAIIKAIRWAYYLRAAQLDISWRDGMTTYLAGMSASALPGGSVLPARLAQEHGHVRMREAASGIFVSFAADTIAISLVAYAGMLAMRRPGGNFVLPALGFLIATILIAMGRSERVWQFVGRLLLRWRLTQGWLSKEEDLHYRVAALMHARVIATGVGFSTVTTLISAAILFTVANGLTFTGLSAIESVYVHGVSEVAAMVIPVPAGIGVSDSSMAGLMTSVGIGWIRATYVVLAIRSVDLLFKTIAGSIVLVVRYHELLASILKIRRRAKRAWRFGRRVTGSGMRLAWHGMTLRFIRGRPRIIPVDDDDAPTVADSGQAQPTQQTQTTVRNVPNAKDRGLIGGP